MTLPESTRSLEPSPEKGKTLIARKIAEILNTRNVKIINGPEVFSKYMGEAEKTIRELFKEAQNDQKINQDYSSLHVMIFYEIDTICKKRGMINVSTRAHDNIVNQLLCDRWGQLPHNVLLIGLTKIAKI